MEELSQAVVFLELLSMSMLINVLFIAKFCSFLFVVCYLIILFYFHFIYWVPQTNKNTNIGHH